jgi:class 3 adenylate cyclase/predicted ATPase
MQCPRCQHENRPQAKFCEECAAPLARACSNCGTPLSPNAKFCPECAHPVAAGTTEPRFASPESYTPKHLAEKILTSKAALEGERKLVTVLFADLKGSMELLADRDPEEARKLLDPVLERMMEAVHRYEGTVNQVMGDGIMALFGAPVAQEDHAVRACYAALSMQEGARRYAASVFRSHGVSIQIRVGLNSGEVVVRAIGSDLHMDYTAVGQTTHLAARMEQLAEPGTTLLTPATLALAEGFVQVTARGPVPVKGLADLVEVFALTGASPVRSRLHAAAAQGLTPFVGRDAELELLRRTLTLAGSGRGQVVAIVGEPGVGKSRLVWEFTHSHRSAQWLVLEAASVSYGKATTYFPVIELLRGYFQIEARDDVRRIREKVTGKLVSLDRALEATLPVFFSLLDVGEADPEWARLDPSQRRRLTLDALKRLLLRESQVQPLLLVFEDLHWIDTETQALLDLLVESLPTALVLLLVNYRPEYTHAWGSKTSYQQVRLDALPATSAAELLDGLLGVDAALGDLKRRLIERTHGNPFFLEESVRALVETKALAGTRGAYVLTGAMRALQLPATAQAILAARIDRLAPGDKRLLQAASVIGKDVPLALLQAVAEESEDVLRRTLGELQATEFIYETRLFPDTEYTFKHALTHEVTYGTLLNDRRRTLHARIVEAIERLYSDRLGEQVDLLAHHAVRGEVWEKAVVYLREAGTKALLRSANTDAVNYFTRGLEAVEGLADSGKGERHELALLLALGPAIQAAKGLGAPEAERVFVRARELSERFGEPRAAFQALWGQWMFEAGQARIEPARRIGRELLGLAARANDRALTLEAHHAMWATSFWLGELAAARAHTDQGIVLYDREQHRSLAFLYGGHDPGACCHYFSAWLLWLAGRPVQAVGAVEVAIALANQLAHPPTTAIGLTWACALLYLGRDVGATGRHARRLIDLSTEQDLPAWRAAGLVFDGWARAETGERGAGVTQIQEGVTASKTTGTLLSLAPLYMLAWSDALLKSGLAVEGLAVVDETLASMATSGVRVFHSEFHRLRGELLLARSPSDHAEAETCFRQAVDVARHQGAPGWELRAATSLSRLLGRQGKRDEGRQTLAPVYDRFTEGFDTADLREAKAILEELS